MAPATFATFATLASITPFVRTASAQSPPAAPLTIAVGDFQLAPTLEIRTRAEYRRDPVDLGGVNDSGAWSPRVRDAVTVTNRARVGLGAERGALRAQVTLQDARAWGAVPPAGTVASAPTFAGFGAYEAFAEVHTVPTENALTLPPSTTPTPNPTRQTFLRIGRQAVRWGDGLLLGTADWSPAGRSLDAIRGQVVVGNWDFELLAAVLAAPRPVAPASTATDTSGPFSGGTELFGARAAWSVDPLLKIEIVAIARIANPDTDPTTTSLFSAAAAEGETYTASARVSGEHGMFEYGVEGVGQLGHSDMLEALVPSYDGDRAAFAAAGHASVRFDALPLAPTLRVGVAYASGESGSHHGSYGQFDPILPDVHTHFGAMDVFALSNIVTAHARVTVAPTDELRASVEYRYARLATPDGEWLNGYLASIGRPNSSAGGGAELGHELDVMATWQPFVSFAVHGGYSLLALGGGARAALSMKERDGFDGTATLAAARFAHVAYVQATLRVP